MTSRHTDKRNHLRLGGGLLAATLCPVALAVAQPSAPIAVPSGAATPSGATRATSKPRAFTGTNAYPVPTNAQGYVFHDVPISINDKVIALTFDDGPNPGYTEQVLSVLAKNNVLATFFEVGANLAANPALGRATRDAGHAIGNHTYSHQEAPADPKGEVQSADVVIQNTFGGPTALFRPPYGNFDNGVVQAALNQGDAVIVWSCDPNDWAMPGTQAIINAVVAGATNGGIVLMHDGGGDRSQTIAALPSIISQLRAQGYRFVTVPELLALRNEQNGDGLSGTYFASRDLTKPVLTRIDPQLDFTWGKNGPGGGVPAKSFSARWTGQIKAKTSEQYTFYARANDGVRVWLGGKLLIDKWNKPGTWSAVATLSAGVRTDLRVEYFNALGNARLELGWRSASTPLQIVPQSQLYSSAAPALNSRSFRVMDGPSVAR